MHDHRKCDICSNPIEVIKSKDGEVIWDFGNNAWPLPGRACNACNESVVIPARLSKFFGLNPPTADNRT